MIRGRYPNALFCHLIDDTGSLLLVVGEFDPSQVVFTDETPRIEDCIVVRAKFGRVCPLDGIDEIALAGVLHERI